jgi:uncharacterized protein YdaU (DUF1376 family)
MHYYQFNIGDYQSHTAHLEPLEDLAYRRLLDWCYLHERPLPDDIEQISKLIRMRSHTECIASVLQEFFDRTPEGWWKERISKEIEKTGEKSRKASESAKARWQKEKGDANALQAQSGRNATHNTVPKTQDTKPKTQTSVEPQSVSQPVIEIPVLGSKVYGVSQVMVDEWSKAYPAVDVQAELQKMRVWAMSNPNMQKTATGIPRFVNAWLSKAQNEAGKVPSSAFTTQGDRNAKVISGLTRGLLGSGNNVKLLGN